jgi:hypothetical protein
MGLCFLIVPSLVAGIGLGIGVVTVLIQACRQGEAWFRADTRLGQ